MQRGFDEGQRSVPARRYRNVSGRPLDRRVVLKAAAGVGALAASAGLAGYGAQWVPTAGAQGNQQGGGTRAKRHVPDAAASSQRSAAAGGFATFQTDFPFTAIGASWAGGVGLWPVVELMTSVDGENWSAAYALHAFAEDGGRPERKGRIFTTLHFADGASLVRYRTVDLTGNPGGVADLSFVYIDASDGPRPTDLSGDAVGDAVRIAATDTRTPPPIVTREGWGANEGYRFDADGDEIWPPEYATVQKVIIHHTDTSNTQDPLAAIRAIYYYHAVERGWGDIGYNYLVDRFGRIYQGRVGGQNVVGGHAFQFSTGSSAISAIGDFEFQDTTPAAQAGLAAITAFVGRDLDPYGRSSFLQAPNLPNICAHRDVNQTICPGNNLYADLPQLRDAVAAALDELETGFPGGLVVGDRVRVQTADGSALDIRGAAGLEAATVATLADGVTAQVIDGPDERGDGNWYRLRWGSGSGWATAQFLIVDPIISTPLEGVFPELLNVQVSSGTTLRQAASLGAAVLTTVSSTAWGVVRAGPARADGVEWYLVRVQGVSADGWTIKERLTPSLPEPATNARFAVGDTVEAARSISVRSRPGAVQTAIATVSTGTRFQITQAPVTVTGAIWYGVYGPTFGGGWTDEAGLRAVTTAPPPPTTSKFWVGDTVRVTSRLNLRTGPSTADRVIASMPTGTTGTVTAGPRTGNGYVWWQMRTSYGTGWAVQDWLAAVSATPPPAAKFGIGDTVRTTARVNLRSSASTSGTVLATMPSGTTGTVTAGPRSGNGYVWWQIRTSYGTGWAAENWLTRTTSTARS